jgi:acetyl esterase/lipase
MYATRWQEYGFPRPAAAILGYPLTDYIFKNEYESRQVGGVTAFFHASDTAFLGTPEPSAEQLEDVSPTRHVTKDTPPTFLWATAADELVPVQHSLLMATALANAGIPFEIHVFEEGKHGMGLADQASAQALSDCNADAAGWAELAGNWLKKRFALPLPEKSPFELMMEAGGFPG